MTILLIVAVVAFVLLVSLGLVVGVAARRRGSDVALEPPPPRPDVVVETGDVAVEPEEVLGPPEVVAPPRLRDRLGKARSFLAGRVGSVLSRSGIDEETWEEL